MRWRVRYVVFLDQIVGEARIRAAALNDAEKRVWLRRRLHGRHACPARSCPRRRVGGPGQTVWCRDHTDAILAGETLGLGPWDEAVAAAARVGPRRWLLLAEVAVERERLHVDVLASIVAQTEQSRRFNRPCWTGLQDPRLSTPLDERANELLELAS